MLYRRARSPRSSEYPMADPVFFLYQPSGIVQSLNLLCPRSRHGSSRGHPGLLPSSVLTSPRGFQSLETAPSGTDHHSLVIPCGNLHHTVNPVCSRKLLRRGSVKIQVTGCHTSFDRFFCRPFDTGIFDAHFSLPCLWFLNNIYFSRAWFRRALDHRRSRSFAAKLPADRSAVIGNTPSSLTSAW